jgi:NADPH-dependent curcumin reductase CurA
MTVSREIRLKRRPSGLPTLDCFELAKVELPALAPGQVLIRNQWLSVDPYMRARMDERESYIDPFRLGEALEGGAIGEVLESANPDFKPGDCVEHMLGWREYAIWPPAARGDGALSALAGLHKRDPKRLPPQAYLGVAGVPGMTAYAGLTFIGRPEAGETVFVSGAAGAVGSIACQIAKIRGCRVVGSAGSDDKVDWLERRAGVDAAINYRKAGDLRAALGAACPGGIDVYLENVGGAHLEAALECMNQRGRIVISGLISQYNATGPVPGPSNFFNILVKSLRVQGFIVLEFQDRAAEFVRDLSAWIRDGRIVWEETIMEGIERTPEAFLALFSGGNLGKMLVKV